MKLRISIILLGGSLMLNAGCTTVRNAYAGNEQSHFANPAKLNNGTSQPLPAVAEAPVTPVHAMNPGATGQGSMTGMSDPDSWGGALSTR